MDEHIPAGYYLGRYAEGHRYVHDVHGKTVVGQQHEGFPPIEVDPGPLYHGPLGDEAHPGLDYGAQDKQCHIRTVVSEALCGEFARRVHHSNANTFAASTPR